MRSLSECERSECQQRWRCSRLGSLKYRLTHRLLPMLWRKDSGCLSEWLGHGHRGGVFTVPSALCVLQGSTEEAGTMCSFSTSSFLEFSKHSFCFAAVIMLRLQDLHTNSEHNLAGKSSPATVLSWLYNSVGPALLCSDCCNRYRSMGFR